MKRPVVLVIGGLDPSGGAGLAADVQTVTALGGHPAPAASLVTVQHTRRLLRSETLRPELVAAQAQAILADMPVAGIKLGALGSAAIGRTVAEMLAGFTGPVVTDPVLAASHGGGLAEPALLSVYREALLPASTVATPNRREFEALGGEQAVARWLESGLAACLVTGGEGGGARVRHTLHTAAGVRVIDAGERLAGRFHGTGCTLASAIAVRLALGDDIPAAIEAAEQFVRSSLSQALVFGKGPGIPGRW